MVRTRVETEGECYKAFPIDDRIYLGEGLFETIKVEAANPFYADLHWQRLSESAKNWVFLLIYL